MTATAELDLPIRVTTQTMEMLEGEVNAADAWGWIQKLIQDRFLVTCTPGRIDGIRAEQRVRLTVRMNGA